MALLGELAIAVTANTLGFDEKIKRSRKEAAEFRKDLADTGRVLDSLKTPADRYNDALARLDDLYRKGMLSAEQHAAAQKRLSDEFEAASGKAFGPSAMTRLAGYAAGVASVSTAFGLASKALNDFFADGERGMKAMEERRGGFARLVQVASGRDDLLKMESSVAKLQEAFGMSQNDAANMVFNARSTGFEGELLTVGNAARLVGSDAAGVAAGQFRTLFGSKDKMSAKQAIAMGLTAAENSIADFSQLMTAAPQAAEAATSSGTGASELLAMMSVLSKKFKTPATASERINAFLSKVSLDENLSKLGGMGAFEALQGMSEEDRAKFLGADQSVNAVFSALQEDGGAIRDMQKRITQQRILAGRGQSWLDNRLGLMDSSVTMEIMKQRDIEKMREDNSLLGEGQLAMMDELQKSQVNRMAREQGTGARIANSVFGATPQWFQRMVTGGVAQEGVDQVRQKADKAGDHAEKMIRALEKIEANTGKAVMGPLTREEAALDSL